MDIFHVQFQLLSPTESVIAHFALMIADVQMHELHVGIQVAIRHEFIPANVTRIFFQLEMYAVNMLLRRAFFREFLSANVAFRVFFLLVYGLDVFLKSVFPGSLLSAIRANEFEIEIIGRRIVIVTALHVTAIAHFVLEHLFTLVALVNLFPLSVSLVVFIVVDVVFVVRGGFLLVLSRKLDVVHELLVELETVERGVGALTDVANVFVVVFVVDSPKVVLEREQ